MNDKIKFEIKPEHLKLIKEMNVEWNDDEHGAPTIDPKRPYGNSDVEQDMIEILGLKTLREGVYELDFNGKKWLLKGEDEYNIEFTTEEDEELQKQLNTLHEETKTALQICLTTQEFKTGLYERQEYSNKWRYLGRKNGTL